MSDYGELIAPDTVQFKRLLPGTIDLVWSYLVDGEKRRLWLAGGDTEVRAGGRVDLHFHNATLSPGVDEGGAHEHAELSASGVPHRESTRCGCDRGLRCPLWLDAVSDCEV